MLTTMNPMVDDAEPDHSPPATYLFTLRFWIDQSGAGESWRSRLESVSTGQVRHCRDWPQLVSHLREMLDDLSAPDGQ